MTGVQTCALPILIQLLFGYGYLGASKVIMKWLGVDVGPCRQPIGNLNAEQAVKLRRELEVCGFFEWGQKPKKVGRAALAKA